MSLKFENLLNLALETPLNERMQSDVLNTGFDMATDTWEVIVKYHDSLDELATFGIQIEYLIAGYAILTVPEQELRRLADTEEIEYVEIPKEFFYEQVAVNREPCIRALTAREPFLSGAGTLVAVLDSGITIDLPEFRRADGSTRIQSIWDQTTANAQAPPPAGFYKGAELSEEQINEILQYEQALEAGAVSADSAQELLAAIGRDRSGHGTAVAGIAAGSEGGVAPDADLLIVKMDSPQTADLMRAVTYVLGRARELRRPLVINISLGNTYGSHDGTSLLERFLDNATEIGRTVICVGSGNEGSSGGHYEGAFRGSGSNTVREAGTGERGFTGGFSAEQENESPIEIEIAVDMYQLNLSIQLWKNYQDSFRIYLQAPDGSEQLLSQQIQTGKFSFVLSNTKVLAYLGEPLPYSVNQEIFMDLLPLRGNYINSGIWRLRIEPEEIRVGNFSVYLPSYVVRNQGTRFTGASAEATLTIPSTAAKVITIGAYNKDFESYAEFSGRGFRNMPPENLQNIRFQKPDLVAPGVDIVAPDIRGGFTTVTGTSFATPIVSGSAALLMEWGIVRGNDPFLYGEKLKAYLRSGSRPLRGQLQIPDDRVGYGLLCTADSLPL